MQIRRFTGGTLLISGTCIGAGMLALPMTMSASGFYLAILLLIMTWYATYISGLFVLEANLALTEGANFVSMAKNSLGRGGEFVAWTTYLLLLYSLMAAYLSAGGDIVDNAISRVTDFSIQDWIGPLPWVIIVGIVIYSGARFVDGLNRFLFSGLIVTYLLLVVKAFPHTEGTFLAHSEWGHYLSALPVVVTAFGYHVIIPSLRRYMHGDVKKLSRTILMGSLLPLFVYIVWDFVVFGTIPMKGINGLEVISAHAHPTVALTKSMALLVKSPAVINIAQGFIFFAIASSFLGIAFSLFDFLIDGFAAHKSENGRMVILFATFLPPLIFALAYPRGFLLALSYAGVFVAILHGILPALMVYFLRKNNSYALYRAPGGNIAVLLIIAGSLLVIAAQFMT